MTPTLIVESEGHELDHLWPGHHVYSIQLEFRLNQDYEPTIDLFELRDSENGRWRVGELSPEQARWFEELWQGQSDASLEEWRNESYGY